MDPGSGSVVASVWGSGDGGACACGSGSVSARRLGTTVNVLPFRLCTSGLGAGTRWGGSTSISSIFVMGSWSEDVDLGDAGGDSGMIGEEGGEVGDAGGTGLVATGDGGSVSSRFNVLGKVAVIVTGFETGLVGDEGTFVMVSNWRVGDNGVVWGISLGDVLAVGLDISGVVFGMSLGIVGEIGDSGTPAVDTLWDGDDFTGPVGIGLGLRLGITVKEFLD